MFLWCVLLLFVPFSESIAVCPSPSVCVTTTSFYAQPVTDCLCDQCESSCSGTHPCNLTRSMCGPPSLNNSCRYLYMTCSSLSTDAPTVVLVTGQGERGDNWMITADPSLQSVFDGVKEAGLRVCVYDRPGTRTGEETSRSSPQPSSLSVTIRESARDLHTLLNATKKSSSPSYILVGHSLGGPIIRQYAAMYPQEVAGFVFVDALSEDLGDYLEETDVAYFEQLNEPTVPCGERTLYSSVVVPVMRSIRNTDIPRVPTIVLSAGIPFLTSEQIDSGVFPPYITQDFVDKIWRAQLAAQPRLALKFPGAKHLMDINSTHYIHLYQPKIVIDSITGIARQLSVTTTADTTTLTILSVFFILGIVGCSLFLLLLPLPLSRVKRS